MKKERYTFPAIFHHAGDGISVNFPDLPGALTCGKTEDEALRMARECLELHIFGLEDDNEVIPDPSTLFKLREKLAWNESMSLVEVWMPPFRDKMANRAVKKTLTIPKWLDDLAAEQKVNYSHILQDALKSYLGVSERP
ncbi:type II toxin-antitoxin system HicB family antitoxin [Bacillus sp. 3255]|uniref:type II toxin-antitoxin system HicB family antitoxin n=1 Tax=Bacillus sp. 3255 TaxID=2817904 RepID=UPI00286AAF21|nr:type II toxin-antitoxin system HicB family antitoxin [Bacillus sp. 3255]